MDAIKFEQELHTKIYKALRGDLVQQVISETSTSLEDIYFKSYVAGHSLPVSKKLMPHVYQVCQDALRALDYKEPVEFYVSSDADVNAFSLAPLHDSEPAIISINSGLLKLMSDDELMFVIGHEIGHLINGDTKLGRIVDYVFPNDNAMPASIDNLVHLQEQLAELVADRWGYTAVLSKQDPLAICVSAMYKLASGVDFLSMDVSIDELLAENKRNLKYFQESGVSAEDHPVNPIRIEALRLYHVKPRNINARINSLIKILLNIFTSKDDEPMSRVLSIYVNQLIAMGVTVDEIWCEHVYEILGCYVINTGDLIELERGATTDDLKDAVNEVLELDPSKRGPMMDVLCRLAFFNNNLNQKTLDYVTRIFVDVFECSEKEVYQTLGHWIATFFSPRIIDMV